MSDSPIKPKGFRQWFEDRHGFSYPAIGGEAYETVFRRLAEDFADYVDEVSALQSPTSPIGETE